MNNELDGEKNSEEEDCVRDGQVIRTGESDAARGTDGKGHSKLIVDSQHVHPRKTVPNAVWQQISPSQIRQTKILRTKIWPTKMCWPAAASDISNVST